MKTSRLGEISKNRFGTEMKIIRYRTTMDMDVQFEDEHKFVTTTCYQNFLNGNVKNPYDRSICGVGYLGEGPYMAKIAGKDTKQYQTWKNLIERCYGDWEMFASYTGVATVCDEWQNYQNFAKWYDENKYQVKGRLHLDKDILFPGNKEYSPDKCLLVPQRINMLFVGKKNDRRLPPGIKETDTGKYTATYNVKYLGTFTAFEEACAAYKTAKEKHIKEVADEFVGVIPKRVYDALIGYRVVL